MTSEEIESTYPWLELGKPWVDLDKFVEANRTDKTLWSASMFDEMKQRHRTLSKMRLLGHTIGAASREFSKYPRKTGRTEFECDSLVKEALSREFVQLTNVPVTMRDMKAEGYPLRFASKSQRNQGGYPVLTDDNTDALMMDDFFFHPDGSVFRIFEQPGFGTQATFECLNQDVMDEYAIGSNQGIMPVIQGLSSIACKFMDGVVYPAGMWMQHGIATKFTSLDEPKRAMAKCHIKIVD